MPDRRTISGLSKAAIERRDRPLIEAWLRVHRPTVLPPASIVSPESEWQAPLVAWAVMAALSLGRGTYRRKLAA